MRLSCRQRRAILKASSRNARRRPCATTQLTAIASIGVSQPASGSDDAYPLAARTIHSRAMNCLCRQQQPKRSRSSRPTRSQSGYVSYPRKLNETSFGQLGLVGSSVQLDRCGGVCDRHETFFAQLIHESRCRPLLCKRRSEAPMLRKEGSEVRYPRPACPNHLVLRRVMNKTNAIGTIQTNRVAVTLDFIGHRRLVRIRQETMMEQPLDH
ncbi:hypothetical protein AB7M49_003890 [Bradyrhizobium elkanii]